MDIHPIISSPLAFVEPELYQGLYFSFWKITKFLAYSGGVSASAFLLVVIGRRYVSVAQQKGDGI